MTHKYLFDFLYFVENVSYKAYFLTSQENYKKKFLYISSYRLINVGSYSNIENDLYL